MRKLLLAAIFVLTMFSVTVSYGANVIESIKERCKDKWPTDYEMQKNCVDTQIKEALKFREYGNTYVTPYKNEDFPLEARILLRCYNEGIDEKGRPDYEMINYCADAQIKAYKALQ